MYLDLIQFGSMGFVKITLLFTLFVITMQAMENNKKENSGFAYTPSKTAEKNYAVSTSSPSSSESSIQLTVLKKYVSIVNQASYFFKLST